MKLDIDTIIKYAYLELPESKIEELDTLFYSDEYALEYDVAKSIIDIGIRKKMNMSQMQVWVKENAQLLVNTLKQVHQDKTSSLFDKIKETEQQVIRWFDENILLNKPALQLAKTRVSAKEKISNDAVKINISNNILSAELNFLATKAIKIIIEDTEGKKFLNTKLSGNSQINLSTLNLHAGAYLWITNSTEIELQYGVFYIDEHLNPKQP